MLFRSAMTSFRSAYNDWSGAYNRYTKATANTTAAVPTYVPSGSYAYSSYIGVEVYINLEVRAINSVISAEEPKLQSAQEDIVASGNEPLSRVTAQLIDEIQTTDQYSLMWSQSRSRLVYAVAAGQYPPAVDQSAAERVRDAMAVITTSQTQLSIGDPCTSD